MRKTILILLAMLCVTSTVVRADDVAEVQKAFDLLIQYQKTDDERSLDLFAQDVSVTVTLDTGKETRDITLPADVFRKAVARDLAAKRGNNDTYENVKYTQDGETVKVTCTLLDAKSGKREPFLAVYVKDGSGQFKVKAMKITMAVDKLPAAD